MNNIMEGFSTFSQGAVSWLQYALSKLSPQAIGLILLALVLLIVVLIILLAVRGRKYDEAMDLIDQQVDAIVAAKRDAQATIDQKLQEQQQREAQRFAQISQREQKSLQEIAGREREFADKEDELRQLRQFKEQYGYIDDINAEIRRMMDEAQDYADDLKTRAEHEYANIINHAQSEAAAVREMAQGVMTRSHDAMKKALDRAREIVEDAKRESALTMPKIPAAPRVAAPPSDGELQPESEHADD